MRNRSVKTAVAAALLAAMGSVQADTGVGVRVSSLGAGVEVGTSLTDFFNLRLGLNKYSTSDTDTIDGINYNTDVDFQSTSLLLDWNPMGGAFHLTVGYLDSGNEIGVNAHPAVGSVIDVGTYSHTITSANEIVLDGKVKLGSGPYLGLGWGNVPARGLGFTFEVGVVQMGKPDVSLAVSGTNTAVVNTLYNDGGVNHVAQEEANMQADLDEFDTYPVVAVGISFGF